jgi:hypothetical protein
VTAEALTRVLDRNGIYWGYPGEATDDPSVVRTVELRLDAPPEGVGSAVRRLEVAGWVLHAKPDPANDPHQRLYFRKNQNLLDDQRTAMLTTAIEAAQIARGQFCSWLERPDDLEN